MKPIRFTCRERLPGATEAIQAAILDPARWPEFQGWEPLLGIASAEFALESLQTLLQASEFELVGSAVAGRQAALNKA